MICIRTYNVRVPSNSRDSTAASLSKVAHASHTSNTGTRIRKSENLSLGFEIPDNSVSCGGTGGQDVLDVVIPCNAGDVFKLG